MKHESHFSEAALNIAIIRDDKKCELASVPLKACLLMHTDGCVEHIFIVWQENDQTMCQTAPPQRPPSQGHKMRQNEK